MRRLVPVVAALLCAGCFPLRWTTFYPSASLAGAVDFQVCRQWQGFMDTGTGWCLDLAVPAERVRAGEEVRVPEGGVRAKFGGLPWSRPSGSPTGIMRFVEVREDRVLAEMDLSAGTGEDRWALRRQIWFRRARPAGDRDAIEWEE